MKRIAAVVGTIGVLAYFHGLGANDLAIRLAAKPLPAIALAAWVALPWRGRPASARLIAAGLILSALGDLLLELPMGLFVHGLAAFLLAHVAYTVGFTRGEPSLRPLRALPFVAYGVGMTAFLWPMLGPMRAPVLAYVIAICAMLWRAAATVRAGAWWGLAGALSFAVSDTLIALDRFHGAIPRVRWPIMGLYYLGQLGIAAWAARSPAPAARDGSVPERLSA